MIRIFLTVTLVATALCVAGYWFYRTRFAVDHIEYLGETFQLPRVYATYEAYRDDPKNLGSANLARIQTLVQTRSPGDIFPDAESFGRAAFALKVPGYGMAGLTVEASEPKPMLVAIEVPGTKKWRYLLAATSGGAVRVVDDFVSEEPRVIKVVVRDGVATYLTAHNTLRGSVL